MQNEEQPKDGGDANLNVADRLEEVVQVLRAKAGDTEAFAWLMSRHERPLVYYLGRFIPGPENVLDVHQEVWLAVFRGLPRLRQPQAFRGWLYRLAHDKAVRFIRKDSRENKERESFESNHEVELAAMEADPERIHQALALLTAPLREVLTLHYLRDLNLEEISLACKTSVGTVKSRLYHARLALRRHLERKEYERS